MNFAHATRLLSLALTSTSAIAGSTTTYWLAPTAGDFAARANWSAGVPGAGGAAVFGVEDGSEPFEVSVARSTALANLDVVNQSPTFVLNGSTMSVASLLVSGVLAPTVTFKGGTLEGMFSVGGARGAGTLVLDEVYGNLGETVVGKGVGGTLRIQGATSSSAYSIELGSFGDVTVSDGATLSVFLLSFSDDVPSASLTARGPGSNVFIDMVSAGKAQRYSIEDGASIGLSTPGGYELDSNDELRFVVGEHGSGFLTVYGGIVLGGKLTIELADGVVPPPGTVVPLMQAPPLINLTGAFESATVPMYGDTPMSVIVVGNMLLGIVPDVSASLTIVPNPFVAPIGYPAKPKATVVFEAGSLPVANGVDWSIDDPALASVTSTGVVTGLVTGSTTLRASYAGLDAAVPIEIMNVVPTIERVSESSDGIGGNSSSGFVQENFPSISGDGRYTVFTSGATNLVDDDTNGHIDVFLHDSLTDQTKRMSVANNGEEGDDESKWPAISQDGRFVSFGSGATNLDPRQPDAHLFIYDVEASTIEGIVVEQPRGNPLHVSVTALSAEGRFVAIVAENRVLRLDRSTGAIDVVVAPGDEVTYVTWGMKVAIDADGSSVGFVTQAHLVAEQTGSAKQAWLRDFATGELICASRRSDGTFGDGDCRWTHLSADGRFVAFASEATNLVDGATSTKQRAYVFDRATGAIELASVNDVGVEADGLIGSLSMSSDARFVTFRSPASNLVEIPTSGVSQVYRRDRLRGVTEIVSIGPAGIASGPCEHGTATSADGAAIAFGSNASNLTPWDTNGFSDMFLRTLTGSVFGDLDGDGAVGGADLGILVGAWGTNAYFSDLDHDGSVGVTDLALLLGAWGSR